MNLELDFGVWKERKRRKGEQRRTSKKKKKEVTRERERTKVEKLVCKMLFIPPETEAEEEYDV